jgi:hypothetical protein
MLAAQEFQAFYEVIPPIFPQLTKKWATLDMVSLDMARVYQAKACL